MNKAQQIAISPLNRHFLRQAHQYTSAVLTELKGQSLSGDTLILMKELEGIVQIQEAVNCTVANWLTEQQQEEIEQQHAAELAAEEPTDLADYQERANRAACLTSQTEMHHTIAVTPADFLQAAKMYSDAYEAHKGARAHTTDPKLKQAHLIKMNEAACKESFCRKKATSLSRKIKSRK